MTVYAYDATRAVITANWSTSAGRCATDVLSVPSASLWHGRQLALAFELLSSELWRAYIHPASEAASLEVNTEGWRREHRREDFAEVVAAIRGPNLPQNGMILQTTSPLEEAHQLGRALQEAGPLDVEQALAEAQLEIDAIERAERGEFTERAAQALEFSRTDVSPTQVTRAHELLRQNPLLPNLADELDPTSAAAAVAQWLRGAAEMTAPSARVSPEDVVLEADNIYAQDVGAPTEVISRLLDGEDPTEVVVEIVRHASELAEGEAANIIGFMETLNELVGPEREAAARSGESRPCRLALVDPRRPAPSLLASLEAGIRACALLYDSDQSPDLDDDVEDEAAAELRDQQFVADLRAHMDRSQ